MTGYGMGSGEQGPGAGVELQPGMTFGGYRIEAIAGRGGMGVVCRATHLALDRTVALKVIAPALAGDPRFRERFARECRLAATLDHPNVVPIIDAGEVGGLAFVSMRWIDGPDMRTLIDEEGRLEPARALALVGQVASALDAAHAAGLVHRDVKPANILIERTDAGEQVTLGYLAERAFLGDFGLVKRAGGDPGLTGSQGWLGTVDYVSPEQVRGEEVGAAADVYALGGVLFTALTGRVPFPQPDIAAKLWATVNDPVPALEDVPAPLNGALDAVLARAMAKDPAQRPASAGAFVAEVHAAFDAASRVWASWQAPAPKAPPTVGSATAPDAASGGPLSPESATAGGGGWGAPAPGSPPPAPGGPRRRRVGRRGALVSAAAGLAVLALVVVAVLTSGGGGHHHAVNASQPRPAPVPATSSGGPKVVTVALAGSSGSLHASLPSKPLGQTSTFDPGINLEVWSAQRNADTVDVVFALDNTTGQDSTSAQSFIKILQALDGNNVTGEAFGVASQIGLLDPSALKEYVTFYNTNNSGDVTDCLCSSIGSLNVAANSRSYLGAVFPAPPAGTSTVTFVTQIGDVTNVRIAP